VRKLFFLSTAYFSEVALTERLMPYYTINLVVSAINTNIFLQYRNVINVF